jgi:hypothetical protein
MLTVSLGQEADLQGVVPTTLAKYSPEESRLRVQQVIPRASGRNRLAGQPFTMVANDFGSRLAPPTSAPSISSSAIKDLQFSGLTLPP